MLVLKDSVKDRCTFTPSDSFNAFEARVTRDKIDRYKAKVAEMLAPGGGLPEADRKALLDDPTTLNAMFAALDQMEGEDFGAGRPFLDAFQSGPLREVDPNPASLLNYRLANAAIDVFSGQAGSRRPCDDFGADVAPNRRLQQGRRRSAIVAGVQDDTRINLPINNYLEAQVYGGVDLASDVAEIRYFAQEHRYDDAPAKEGVSRLRRGGEAAGQGVGCPRRAAPAGRGQSHPPHLIQAARHLPELEGIAKAATIGSLDDVRIQMSTLTTN